MKKRRFFMTTIVEGKNFKDIKYNKNFKIKKILDVKTPKKEMNEIKKKEVFKKIRELIEILKVIE